MNPLAMVVGGILLAATLFGAGYTTGKHIAQGKAAEATELQREAYEQQLDDRQDLVDQAAKTAAHMALQLADLQRMKTKGVIRYVQTPAAAVACLDDDGVRIWNADAETGTGPVQPGKLQPGTTAAEHPR